MDPEASAATENTPKRKTSAHLVCVLAAECEAETGAAFSSTGREERLEDVREMLRRNAGAIVAHREDSFYG